MRLKNKPNKPKLEGFTKIHLIVLLSPDRLNGINYFIGIVIDHICKIDKTQVTLIPERKINNSGEANKSVLKMSPKILGIRYVDINTVFLNRIHNKQQFR